MRILNRLLRYLGRHRRLAVLGIASVLIGIVLQLTVPLFIKQVIDDGLSGADPAALIWPSVAVVLFTVLQGFFHYGRSYVLEDLAQRVAYDIRNDVYRHLQRLSFTYYDQAQTGQIITKVLEDTAVIRQFFAMAIRMVLIMVMLAAGVSVVLIALSWQLALVTLAVMPIIAGVAIYMGVKLRPLFRMVQDRFGALTNVMQENLAGARVVRSFAREQHEIERFRDAGLEFNAANMTTVRLWAFRNGFLHFLSLLTGVVVLLYGGWMVLAGSLTVGTLVAFNRYLTLLGEPLQNLGMIVNVIARAIASGERIYDIMDVKPEIVSRPGALTPAQMEGHVRFEKVSFAYLRNTPVIHDIDFEAPPGTVTALFGPTGAGKSTITALIPRFYDATAGRVLIDGHDVRDLDLDFVRRNVGLVMQETLLFSATVRENIAFGRQGRAGLPLHLRHARRLRLGHRRARREPLGRAEAARGDRPRAGAQPAHPDPRRRHRQRRYRDRAPDPPGIEGVDAGAHDLHHRPAPDQPETGRSDPRHRQGPHRPARAARRVGRPARPLSRCLRSPTPRSRAGDAGRRLGG
jgi:ABC-type multidrug transport system fused ATPase/permease subunit